jgi:hypothetical protein
MNMFFKICEFHRCSSLLAAMAVGGDGRHSGSSAARSHQSVCSRAPTLGEWLVLPTVPVWAIVTAAPNFEGCSAIPRLSLFIVISSIVVEISEVIKWVYRIPFFPHLRERCLPTLFSATLDAANVGLVSWGGFLTYGETSRLAHSGGEGCTLPIYLTGFLCALIPSLLYLLIAARTARFLCTRRAPVDPLLDPTPCTV